MKDTGWKRQQYLTMLGKVSYTTRRVLLCFFCWSYAESDSIRFRRRQRAAPPRFREKTLVISSCCRAILRPLPTRRGADRVHLAGAYVYRLADRLIRYRPNAP